jgi:hypothetical protein
MSLRRINNVTNSKTVKMTKRCRFCYHSYRLTFASPKSFALALTIAITKHLGRPGLGRVGTACYDQANNGAKRVNVPTSEASDQPWV